MSHPTSPPSQSAPLAAASLLLLRDCDGLEVLVGRRDMNARAFPGATAFPGGKVMESDADGLGQDPWRIGASGAVRETFEETGLLVCASGEGLGRDVQAAWLELQSDQPSFAELTGRWGCQLDLARLIPFARWITPERAPYRFDALFFLAAASAWEASAPLICAEFESLAWARPGALLRDTGHSLLTPTRHSLQVLCESSTVAEAIAAARERTPIDGDAVRAARGGGQTRDAR